MVLALFVLYFVWPCGCCSLRSVFIFVLFVALLLSFVGPVWNCDYLDGEKGADHFAFLWFVACVLSVMVDLFFLLGSLVDCVL